MIAGLWLSVSRIGVDKIREQILVVTFRNVVCFSKGRGNGEKGKVFQSHAGHT